MDAQTIMIKQTLTTAEAMRNQTQLVMKPYSNWEEYLTPTPLTLAILGELGFISSKTDFSIKKDPSEHGYEYIKYPDSFSACLMQVCNSGWKAFNEAHNNMDQIRLHTTAVPDCMNMAMKILFQDSDRNFETLLPNQLDNIRDIADKCLTLASATEKHFTDVLNIIHELLEACMNAEICHGKEMDAIKKNLENAKIKKDSTEKALNDAEKIVKDTEEQLKEAYKTFNKALESMPSEYKVVHVSIWSYIFRTAEERAFKKSSENAKFRIEESRKELNKSREAYEKSVQNMEKNQEELTNILASMRNCEVRDIDFNTAIQMLVKGMDAMGKVKEQWEKLVGFFQLVSNIVKITMKKNCDDFVKTSEVTKEFSHNEKLYMKDLIYNQAFQASNIAGVVHLVSTTYTEVSRTCLMDTVGSLGKLMAMDKETEEFVTERDKFRESCNEAQKTILKLVLKSKEEFERKSDERLEKINKELHGIDYNNAADHSK